MYAWSSCSASQWCSVRPDYCSWLSLLIFLVSRRRRMSSSVDDAVMEALQRMSKAAPDLREGLTQEAADKATPAPAGDAALCGGGDHRRGRHDAVLGR